MAGRDLVLAQHGKAAEGPHCEWGVERGNRCRSGHAGAALVQSVAVRAGFRIRGCAAAMVAAGLPLSMLHGIMLHLPALRTRMLRVGMLR